MALGRGPVLVYTSTGLLLATLPLFGILHVEASAVVAFVAFFTAGLSVLGREAPLRKHLRDHALGLLIPYAFLTATLLWRPNCDYLAGLGFYTLFAVVSMGFGSTLAYALGGTQLRRKQLLFTVLGLGIATLPVLYDLGFHPQLYTYNHVWGGVLGPIYDEELAVRSGLFAFRGLTLLWMVLFVGLGRWLRTRKARPGWIGVAAADLLILGYALGPALGINTTYAVLERALDGRAESPGFVIHYDADSFQAQEVASLQDELAFRHATLQDGLGVAPAEPIHVYIYPDAETRGRLIGSRQTSVTPVWLAHPQLHMLHDALASDALGHELVHVFSREFGLPILNASLAVGLVEGLAVALGPPDGLPSPSQQIAATLRMQADSLGALEEGPADAVVGAMSPFGFWTGRGAVSYVTTGSFASWLLDQYGPEAMRQVYASGDFEAAYGQPLDTLAQAWEADLRLLPPSGDAEAIARWRFSQPSLFERRCPHYVPPAVRWTRRARTAEDNGDLPGAIAAYRNALTADSMYAFALTGWAARMAADLDDPGAVVSRLQRVVEADSLAPASVLLALGDAYTLAGDSVKVDTAYSEAVRVLPPWADASRAFLVLRSGLSAASLAALLRLATSTESLEQRVDDEPDLRPFVAWRWRDSGAYERAYAVLAPWTPDASAPDGALLSREALAWNADFALQARQYQSALEAALRARVLFETVGEEGRVRWLDDIIAQSRWHLSRR